jgi:hypothetical protein
MASAAQGSPASRAGTRRRSPLRPTCRTLPRHMAALAALAEMATRTRTTTVGRAVTAARRCQKHGQGPHSERQSPTRKPTAALAEAPASAKPSPQGWDRAGLAASPTPRALRRAPARATPPRRQPQPRQAAQGGPAFICQEAAVETRRRWRRQLSPPAPLLQAAAAVQAALTLEVAVPEAPRPPSVMRRRAAQPRCRYRRRRLEVLARMAMA